MTRLVTERDGKLAMTNERFPRDRLRFTERTMRADISIVIKLTGNDAVDHAEAVINQALSTLRALGQVSVRFDVL